MSAVAEAAGTSTETVKKHYVSLIQKAYSASYGLGKFLKKAINAKIEIIILHGGKKCHADTAGHIRQIKRANYDVRGSGALQSFRKSKVIMGTRISPKLRYPESNAVQSLYFMDGSIQLEDVCTLKIYGFTLLTGCNIEQEIRTMSGVVKRFTKAIMFIAFDDTHRDVINEWAATTDLLQLYNSTDSHFEYLCFINETLNESLTLNKTTLEIGSESYVVLGIETPH